MMRKRLILLILLILVVTTSSVAQSKKFKVGVSIPLSGDIASYGNALRDGMLAAKEDWDKEDQVQFIFEDDGFVSKNTVGNINKFIEMDKVNAAYIFGSTTSLAAVPILEQNKIPVITVATAAEVTINKKYVMNMWATAQMENEAVVAEVKKRGYKTCAVLATNQDGMLALQEAFIKSNVCEVTLSESFNVSELDFKPMIMKIKQRKVDAVYNILLAPQGGNFAKQLRALGFKGELFSAHQIEDAAEIKLADGALLGTWFTSNNLIGAELFQRIEKSKGYQPVYLVGYGYDAAKIFIEGAKEKDFNGYLRHLKDFSGQLGQYSATSEGQFNFRPVIKVVTKNGFEFVH